MKEGEAGSLPSSSPSPDCESLLLPISQPLSSLPRTFANLILCIFGSGVLGMPYTFSTVGWLMGICVIVASCVIVYHGMMLQVYSKRRLRRSRHDTHLLIASYGDLTYHAFGSWGRLAVDVLLTLSTFACAISYITFISQNAASIASGLQGTQLLSANVSGIRPFRQAISANGYENLSNIKFPVPTNPDVCTKPQGNHTFLQFSNGNFSKLIPQNHNLPTISRRMMGTPRFETADLNFSGFASPIEILRSLSWLSSSMYSWLVFPFEVGLAIIPSVTLLAPFSAVGDALSFSALGAVMVLDILTIRETSSFRNMKAFGNMLSVPSAFGVGVYAFQSSGIMIPIEAAMKEPARIGSAMGFAFVLSATIYGAFAVLGYAAFGENTQQVITLNLPGGLETIVIKVAICSSLFLSFPLVLNPMFELVERRFSQRKISVGLRFLLVFVICLSATTVKQFTVFLSLAGSSISCLLGFILPAAVHIKVMKEDVHNPSSFLLYATDYTLIVFGLIFGAFGTTVSFIELLE